MLQRSESHGEAALALPCCHDYHKSGFPFLGIER
jgi:hypothetical protein